MFTVKRAGPMGRQKAAHRVGKQKCSTHMPIPSTRGKLIAVCDLTAQPPGPPTSRRARSPRL